ncbi:MAG: leucine-rich repeat domain-containing protein [Bacteroidales bacterium]|nr:leucine-rich repeat domain-containing protein [Bacteroidales bacterium]
MAIFAMAALGAKAQDSVFSYTYQGTTLYYIIDSVGNATVVPPLWPGFDETNDTLLASVTLPSSLEQIDDRAFYKCKSLQSLSFPDGLTSIGEQAFYRCTGLTPDRRMTVQKSQRSIFRTIGVIALTFLCPF